MPGYIYLLINYSMPGLLKIGLTTRPVDERMRELSGSTSVPTPFVLVFDVLVSDCRAAEKRLHDVLTEKGYRAASNREFFTAPIDQVIRAMLQIAEELPAQSIPDDLPPYEDILELEDPWGLGAIDFRDDLFEEAARIIVRSQQGSVSLLQRSLSVGYTQAARIVDQLEEAGIVGQFKGSKARDVLVSDEMELDEILRTQGVRP
jgi:hypothetical protein